MFRAAAEWCRRLSFGKNKMADIFDDFQSLIKRLNRGKIEYAVCGGWAMAIHGLPLSFDNGAVEIRRISKIDKESKTLFTVDFLLVTEKLKRVWETRERIDFDVDKVWTVSRQGLISMKRMSGRPRDVEDIERLEEIEENES